MSRSHRHTPITGNTVAASEADDKRRASRTLRHAVRLALAEDAELMPLLREVSNTYRFAKDGRHYSPATSMRK